MKIGIPKEIFPEERRVAATPDTVKKMQSLGFEVLVEVDAGAQADYTNEAYIEVGAVLIDKASELWQQADWILKVRPPHMEGDQDETKYLSADKGIICFLWPDKDKQLLARIQETGATAIAIDKIPRITRAQKMDALSSMANISGYRSIVEAAQHFGRFFTGQITAAGKIPPAKVLVIGAGVAGLSAIGTAKGMGAIVRAFDTRPAVKEQVESMGAEFLMLEFEEDGTGVGGYAKIMSEEFIAAEMALFAAQAMEVDIIVTTALVPGNKAPQLITSGMVESMKEGSVIVDLAAEQGGNCALTQPGKVVEWAGVTIIGYTDLPSRMANQSSQLYGTNLCHLLDELGGAEEFQVDLENEVIRGATCVRRGEILWPPPKPKITPTPSPTEPVGTPAENVTAETETTKVVNKAGLSTATTWAVCTAALVALLFVGKYAPASFMQHFSVFVLACLVGYMVIWNVAHSLHTPLMSVTNAISGIIMVGGMVQISDGSNMTKILGAVAIFIATINIVGGFRVTERMLKMFRR